jgi:hypothetical protein
MPSGCHVEINNDRCSFVGASENTQRGLRDGLAAMFAEDVLARGDAAVSA